MLQLAGEIPYLASVNLTGKPSKNTPVSSRDKKPDLGSSILLSLLDV